MSYPLDCENILILERGDPTQTMQKINIVTMSTRPGTAGKSDISPNQQKLVYFTLGLGKESLL